MTTSHADPIAAVNPLSDDAVRRLPLADAERAMLSNIRAVVDPAPVVGGRRAPRPRGWPVMFAASAAAAVAGVVAIVAFPASHHRRPAPPAPAPAFSAQLIRFANASPLVMLQGSGWRVTYADEDTPQSGELDFERAGFSLRTGRPAGGAAGLTWQPQKDAARYIQDRTSEASSVTRVTLLGTTARLFEYSAADGGGEGGTRAFEAIWTAGSRVLVFGGRARTVAAFKAELAHLRHVSNTIWLQAMPPSVINTADRGAVIRTMLKGIPLPPGFAVSQIPGRTLDRDRYQLGAAVTGTVTCEWFARWARARRVGDRAEVDRAVAATATAPRWRVLRQMSRSGDWPSILIGYAKAMRRGRVDGRPLAGDVNGSLGCASEWHVRVGGEG